MEIEPRPTHLSAIESELEKDAASRFEFAQQNFLAAYRSLIISNGGAIVALLTFAGNAEAEFGERGLFWAFVWFALGLTSAILTQIIHAYSTGKAAEASRWAFIAERDSERAGVVEIKLHKALSKKKRFRKIAWFGASAAVVFFVAGAFTSLVAIT